MNEQLSDKIFDSLLEEAISGQRPPDLRNQIHAAWQREKEQGVKKSQLVQAELVPSPPPIASEECDEATVGDISGQLVVEPVESASQVATRLRQRSASRKRSFFAAIASVAAAVLIIAASWQLVVSQGRSGGGQLADGNQEAGVVESSAETTEAPVLADNSGTNSSIEAANSGLPSVGLDGAVAGIDSQVLDLQDLPFPERERSTLPAGNSGDSGLASATRVEPISDLEIVQAIDAIFGTVWSEGQVEPSAPLAAPEMAAKIVRVTTGKAIPAELKANIAKSPESFAQSRFASRVLKTVQHRNYWADRLARNVMRSASLSATQEELGSIRKMFAAQLAQGNWDEVPRKLIAGDLSNPASASTAFVKGLAVGGENHRLVNRLGASFLNTNLSCAKCHDGSNGDVELVLDSQRGYWGLIALLKGLEAKGNPNGGNRTLVDRQGDLFAAKPPTVYYEEQDGNLRSVAAALPGSDWKSFSDESPRAAIANWITQTNAFDRAVVNEAWKQVFGRRLVESSMLEPAVGRELRANALELLAQQFRAHDHDYSKMLSWLISSKVFARSPNNLSSEQWLASNDADLKKLQQAELLFAAENSLGQSREADSIQGSIAAVLKWNGTTLSGNAEATLGQPKIAPMTKPEKIREAMRKQNGMKIAMPSKSYLLHGEIHSDEKTRFVQSIVDNASLTWRNKVEHVVALLSLDSLVNDRFMEGANKILESSDGDQADALLTILWVVQNTEAR